MASHLSEKTRDSRVGQWLRIDPANKPKIYAQIYATAEISSANYWAEILLSAGIATFGLVLNSPAVIIGAMLISPLMGPIMATGLALAAGDLYLAIKAVSSLLASISVAIGLSGFIVWLLPFHSATGEILARTNPNLLDLGIALFSGLAGSIAVGRAAGSDGVTTLPGVAIAVALMPPLCTIGFGLGSGANARIMGGAGLLFITNLVAIVASAFMVFLLIGMNSPAIRAEMEHSRSGEFFARKLGHGPFARAIANGGKLHWRIAMLVVLLGSVAIPLRTALMQLAGEAVARGAVQEVMRDLVPRGSLVSQQVEVGRQTIAIQLVSTKAIPENKLQAAEKLIAQRSGRKTEVSVSSVASQSEFTELMQRISTVPTPPPPPPTVQSLEDIRTQLTARINPVLERIWPQTAPLQSFTLAFGEAGVLLNADYQASRDLDPISIGLIQQQLQESLNDANLQLNVHRTTPPRGTSKRSSRKR
ncbi:TIGR00341 family protein [soil metagenome]